MSADAQYIALMVPAAKRVDADGPRLYWRAVVKVDDHRIEWHSVKCEAPANDCEGCQP